MPKTSARAPDIQDLGPEFAIGSFKGPALKIGAGVDVSQAYELPTKLALRLLVALQGWLHHSSSCMMYIALTWKFPSRLSASVVAISPAVATDL